MNILNKLIASKIASMSRICGMVKIDFEDSASTYCLHIETALFRIIKDGVLLCSNSDMYRPGKQYKKKIFKKFKSCDSDLSLFDEQLKLCKTLIAEEVVENIAINGSDLIVTLANGYRIEVYADTLEEDCEIFRFFIKGDLESHFVVETPGS